MPQDGALALDIDLLRTARVLCIGDVMLDHYVYGEVGRLSPEAPMPVLMIDSETHSLGGAGNVLRNLAALGAQMSFVSVVGNDDAGREIQNLLAEARRRRDPCAGPAAAQDHGQDPLYRGEPALAARRPRKRDPARALYPRRFAAAGARAGHQPRVVVISDYAKGVLTDGVALEIIREAQEAGARVVVEPEGRRPHPLPRRRRADARPPRAGRGDGNAGRDRQPKSSPRRGVLIERCGLGAVFVLLGREGMILVEPRTSATVDPPALVDGYDPGGTEDAAVAALAVGIGAGLSVPHAAELASLAVGIVGAKIGTAVVSAGELAAALASAAYSEPGEAAALRVEVAPQPRRRGQRKA